MLHLITIYDRRSFEITVASVPGLEERRLVLELGFRLVAVSEGHQVVVLFVSVEFGHRFLIVDGLVICLTRGVLAHVDLSGLKGLRPTALESNMS